MLTQREVQGLVRHRTRISDELKATAGREDEDDSRTDL